MNSPKPPTTPRPRFLLPTTLQRTVEPLVFEPVFVRRSPGQTNASQHTKYTSSGVISGSGWGGV